ncbi:MAG: glycosyltransferase [Clostridia bacterium]|nr:glycosyltransferase [Clostridia bacterium]
MKIFYFGSVCSQDVFNKTVEKSKIKPSASAQSFESALIKGFSENTDIDITVASAESIAMFPGGNRIYLKKRIDLLTENCSANIISAINLPLIKQINHADGAVRLFKKWEKENRNIKEKCVLVYGLYPQVVNKLQKACRKHNCKIFALITDIPSTMFTYTKSNNILKALFADSYRKKAVLIQDKFDGYIYLTEKMEEKVAPGKPYIVVETIADTNVFDKTERVEKSYPPAIMYAGALYKKYGVDMIVEAFENVKNNCELWLFGSGDYEDEISQKAKQNPKIKFFGRVSREDVLIKEKEATLLLNIRDPEELYTRYSFPSKMIEYMLSGTPVLTTKLSGIPNEYYSYCYLVNERNIINIAEQIDNILSDGKNNITSVGNKAREFVIREKNCNVQANKIAGFLKRNV